MYVECVYCGKLVHITEAIAIVCDTKNDTIEYLCSKICVKEYPMNFPKIYNINIKKGGKK